MSSRYDQAPERAPDDDLEVHEPESALEVNPIQNDTPAQFFPSPVNQGYGSGFTQGEYAGGNYPSPISRESAVPSGELEKGKGSRPGPFGCSLLVFILSGIIAFLSVAVIGLAAGTGVASNRANDKQSQLDALGASGAPTATVTVTAASPSPTGADAADRGCSTDADAVTGTNYTTQFLNNQTFQVYCNTDTPNNPILSLFVANFNDCMDACAHWTYYLPSDFNISSSNSSARINQTCDGLSFIPLWTDRTVALDGHAPGNCYLKAGPLTKAALKEPNAGTPVHAAILVGSA
ncbi:hypothetical protein SLS62_008105 [Diatrype stigma]|uniref:Uncharacterized protein n=1 Tax=Diatrype stigma TaxID=117547 RepID=A0AAN9ULM9_9PEZI